MTDIKYNPINPDKFLDITKATAYEVAAHSLQHLIDQGCKSVDLNNPKLCMYFGANNTMCGAAPFIREKSKLREGEGWIDQVKAGAAPNDHQNLIERLQLTHDNLDCEYTNFWWDYNELRELIGELTEDESAHLDGLWESILKLHQKLLS